MQGWKLAFAIATLTITGCGAQAEAPTATSPPATAVSAARTAPPAEPPATPKTRRGQPGQVRVGTFRTAAPQATTQGAARTVRMRPVPAARPAGRASFRQSHLAGLRAHCATGPDDPRCDGRRVDARVALAGLGAGR